MAGVAEENRRRFAKLLALLGAGLVLAGVALVLQHRADLAAPERPARGGFTHDNVQLAQDIQRYLLWLLVLTGIFGISTFAFLRWSRRFRNRLLRRPRPPTPAEDVWTMHRLPDEPPPENQTRPEPPPAGGSG